MKKSFFPLMVMAVSTILFGCSANHLSADGNASKKVVTPPKPVVTLTNVMVSKNDGTNLVVSVTAENDTEKAIFVKLSDFALTSGTTTLSPDSKSKIPDQIPANSKTEVTLSFDVKGQLSGTVKPKLDFQASGNESEQFASIGNVSIPVPKSTASNSNPNTKTVVQKHDYQSDIAHDVAIIKPKATIAPEGVQWSPLVNSQPDAEVPDGFGGMIYAWNVILDGNGDGSAQQIFFFDNNRYIGTDTAKYHLDSSVHTGSTGSIVATYQHFLANDPMASPSGMPYTVSFHWNGSNMSPSSVATLNEAVNDQFK